MSFTKRGNNLHNNSVPTSFYRPRDVFEDPLPQSATKILSNLIPTTKDAKKGDVSAFVPSLSDVIRVGHMNNADIKKANAREKAEALEKERKAKAERNKESRSKRAAKDREKVKITNEFSAKTASLSTKRLAHTPAKVTVAPKTIVRQRQQPTDKHVFVVYDRDAQAMVACSHDYDQIKKLIKEAAETEGFDESSFLVSRIPLDTVLDISFESYIINKY